MTVTHYTVKGKGTKLRSELISNFGTKLLYRTPLAAVGAVVRMTYIVFDGNQTDLAHVLSDLQVDQ